MGLFLQTCKYRPVKRFWHWLPVPRIDFSPKKIRLVWASIKLSQNFRSKFEVKSNEAVKQLKLSHNLKQLVVSQFLWTDTKLSKNSRRPKETWGAFSLPSPVLSATFRCLIVKAVVLHGKVKQDLFILHFYRICSTRRPIKFPDWDVGHSFCPIPIDQRLRKYFYKAIFLTQIPKPESILSAWLMSLSKTLIAMSRRSCTKINLAGGCTAQR